MDPIRLGADLRLLRRRKRWSQVRLAAESGVPRWVVSAIETGRADRVAVWRLVAVVAAVGGYLTVRIQFHGEGLDRLRDRRHAALVEWVVTRLREEGWQVATEVSFNVYGERGSIDVLAFHEPTGALLVIEVKSLVPDIGGMLMTFDRKVRLAAQIASDQCGWAATSVSRLLVLPADTTSRRRVAEHASTFETTLPDRGVAVRRWLQGPTGVMAGIQFVRDLAFKR